MAKTPLRYHIGGREVVAWETPRLRRAIEATEDLERRAGKINPQIVSLARIFSGNKLPSHDGSAMEEHFLGYGSNILSNLKKHEKALRFYHLSSQEYERGNTEIAADLYRRAMRTFPLKDSKGLGEKLGIVEDQEE